MTVQIGNWVRRETSDADDEESKWHAVESVVAGAAITRCGRRMEPEVDGKRLQAVPEKPLTRMPGQPHLCQAGCA